MNVYVARTFDAAFVNDVANDPAVVDLVRGPMRGRLDLSTIVEDHSNITLVGEHGFAIFAYRCPGVYELHASVRPEGQGAWALAAARGALEVMFYGAEALAIIAPIPSTNRQARQIVGALGFELKQELPSLWPSADGPVSILIYVLLRKDWLPCQ